MTNIKNLIIALYVKYWVQADRKEKCPSCGIRQKHPMVYDISAKKVLHRCETLHSTPEKGVGCRAIWAIDCLVNPGQWEVTFSEMNEDGRVEVTQPEKKFASAQREPIIIKKEAKLG